MNVFFHTFVSDHLINNAKLKKGSVKNLKLIFCSIPVRLSEHDGEAFTRLN